MRVFDQRTTGDCEARTLAALHEMRCHSRLAEADNEGAVPAFPLKVQVQTSTRCNAACVMCPYEAVAGAPGFAHQQMEEETYRRLLAQLKGRGIERFSPFLMNEPLLDRRMPHWIGWARKALPDATLNLFTNGAALSVELAGRLADAGLDELCVSVHGFEPSAYEHLMGGLSFHRVLDNLARVVAASDEGRLGKLRLLVVTGDVPEITTGLTQAPMWLRPYVLLKGLSNERIVSQATPGLESSKGATPRKTPARPLCQRPFVKLYVMANGDCVACNADWRRREVLGNLHRTDIETIWGGGSYRILRRFQLHDAFPGDHLCKDCDYPWVMDED